MRRNEKQVLDIQEIEGIISRTWILHLAMADGGEPYVVPLNFGYDQGFMSTVRVRGGGWRSLSEITRVCISLYARAEVKPGVVPCVFGMAYESVVGFGEIVLDLAEKVEGLRSIFRQAGVDTDSLPAFSAKHLTLVLRIKVNFLCGKRFA